MAQHAASRIEVTKFGTTLHGNTLETAPAILHDDPRRACLPVKGQSASLADLTGSVKLRLGGSDRLRESVRVHVKPHLHSPRYKQGREGERNSNKSICKEARIRSQWPMPAMISVLKTRALLFGAVMASFCATLTVSVTMYLSASDMQSSGHASCRSRWIPKMALALWTWLRSNFGCLALPPQTRR